MEYYSEFHDFEHTCFNQLWTEILGNHKRCEINGCRAIMKTVLKKLKGYTTFDEMFFQEQFEKLVCGQSASKREALSIMQAMINKAE